MIGRKLSWINMTLSPTQTELHRKMPRPASVWPSETPWMWSSHKKHRIFRSAALSTTRWPRCRGMKIYRILVTRETRATTGGFRHCMTTNKVKSTIGTSEETSPARLSYQGPQRFPSWWGIAKMPSTSLTNWPKLDQAKPTYRNTKPKVQNTKRLSQVKPNSKLWARIWWALAWIWWIYTQKA